MRPVPLAAGLAAALALAVAAGTLVAQQPAPPPGSPPPGGAPPALRSSPRDVQAGIYAIEPNHTQVTFTVGHMGISPYSGTFWGGNGTLIIDPAHVDKATVSVTLPISSVQTTSAELTQELAGADWLDAATYPTATFVSTSVTPNGADSATIKGTLTLHGVSRPATIKARFFGAATNPMSKKDSVGFVGELKFKRSDFGISKFVPMISDMTSLVINAAFEKRWASRGPASRLRAGLPKD